MYSTPSPTPLYSAAPRGIVPDINGRRSPNLSAAPLYSAAPRGIAPDMSGRMSPNPAGFEVEHVSRPPSAIGHRIPAPPEPAYDPEFLYRESVSKLIAAKTRPFSISGRIPLDPSQLLLFFRSRNGTSHALDFPIDIAYSTPPALDAFIAACKRHQIPGFEAAVQEAYYYPPNLALTPSLEIANYPILDAIRTALFPALPLGQFLTVRRDRVDVLLPGGRIAPAAPARGALRTSGGADGRVATLNITLPARFHGGALTIRDTDGRTERLASAAPTTDLEWTAFLGECEHEVETVSHGCRMSIAYAVFSRPFAVGAPSPGAGLSPSLSPSLGADAALFAPSQPFLDLLPPVLQMSRGRKIAFFLSHDYDVDPSVVLADALAPQLKGGDALLYAALKAYKLAPALHWSAGGYIWPLDRPVEMFDDEPPAPLARFGGAPHAPVRGAFNNAMPAPAHGPDALRARVEASGAVLLADADVTLLTDWRAPEGAPLGKARMHFVAQGLLEKLVVNVLLVAFVH